MVIKNKFIGKILTKLLRIEPYSLRFVFVKEIFDPELTKLAFLHQSLNEFNEKAEEFRNAIEEEIAKTTN